MFCTCKMVSCTHIQVLESKVGLHLFNMNLGKMYLTKKVFA